MWIPARTLHAGLPYRAAQRNDLPGGREHDRGVRAAGIASVGPPVRGARPARQVPVPGGPGRHETSIRRCRAIWMTTWAEDPTVEPEPASIHQLGAAGARYPMIARKGGAAADPRSRRNQMARPRAPPRAPRTAVGVVTVAGRLAGFSAPARQNWHARRSRARRCRPGRPAEAAAPRAQPVHRADHLVPGTRGSRLRCQVALDDVGSVGDHQTPGPARGPRPSPAPGQDLGALERSQTDDPWRRAPWRAWLSLHRSDRRGDDRRVPGGEVGSGRKGAGQAPGSQRRQTPKKRSSWSVTRNRWDCRTRRPSRASMSGSTVPVDVLVWPHWRQMR